ncbi:MAG: hypothetical protein WD972_01315 [Candidatus Andersenbacteria bacterium]|jgi:hypothetical protein
MFHPLRSLFTHTRLGWEESDLKYYIEQYLQRRLKTDALYCEKVHQGVIVVRVPTPACQQEVSLLEFDLARDLSTETSYTLRQLIVYTG